MGRKRRLLVLGPSFRRRREGGLLPALERFDGLFYRVARKYLSSVKDVDVVVMVDDLTLVDGDKPLAYREPVGSEWGKQKFSKEVLDKARAKNEDFLRKRLKNGRYSEVYLAMGRRYAEALPDLEEYGVEVVFPTSGGPGPKAQALKEWIMRAR
ncbi:MAG: hypothetical protein QXZ47_05670 [Candidatus Bathyarchaeia archaeon]